MCGCQDSRFAIEGQVERIMKKESSNADLKQDGGIAIKKLTTLRIIRKRIVFIIAPIMLALMLTPAEIWRQPINDAIYHGFDPNIIYISENGYAYDPSSRGLVEITRDCITLAVLPNSRPIIHLITTPLNAFHISMDIRVINNEVGGDSFRIGVWSPRTRSGYFINFGSKIIAAQTVVNGTVTHTLADGIIIKNEVLGDYLPDFVHLEMMFDKVTGLIKANLHQEEAPPSGHNMLRLPGIASPEYFSHVGSEIITVNGGKNYLFGGTVKSMSTSGFYGFTVEWLDNNLKRLGISDKWNSVESLNNWTLKTFKASAPQNASYARLWVATAPPAEVWFSDLFMVDEENPNKNLIPNGDFRNGSEGWRRGSIEQSPIEVVRPFNFSYESCLSIKELPDLFKELRLSLTVDAFSSCSVIIATIKNYTLALPHQRWLAMKVEDVRVQWVVAVLLVIGALLIIDYAWGLILSIFKKLFLLIRLPKFAFFKQLLFIQTKHLSPKVILILIGCVLYLIFNMSLFNLGGLNYDLDSSTVWIYTSLNYGLQELYYLPVVTPPAESWGGVPIQEAAFPYEPVMAYVFFFEGLFYKLFLTRPGALTRDIYLLAYIVRFFNAFFAFLCGLLIYLILKSKNISEKESFLAAMIFMANPAVLFIGSIWGQTQTLSIFFLLMAILMMEKNSVFGAWLSLLATALTREQMLIPAVLLIPVLFKKFPVKENIKAIFWTIIVMFIIVAPFSLSIGPSLPVDILINSFHLHIRGANDPYTTLVSWGALSVWPLVTFSIDGQTGINRIFYSAMEPLIGTITYWHLGNILFIALLILLVIRLAFQRISDYIPFISLGTLGFFMFKTGFSAFHFLPALALLIISRKSIKSSTYYLMVGILSITTFLSMYSLAAFWMTSHPLWNVGIFDPNNCVSGSIKVLVTSDIFITFGSLANLSLLIWLGLHCLKPSLKQ